MQQRSLGVFPAFGPRRALTSTPISRSMHRADGARFSAAVGCLATIVAHLKGERGS